MVQILPGPGAFVLQEFQRMSLRRRSTSARCCDRSWGSPAPIDLLRHRRRGRAPAWAEGKQMDLRKAHLFDDLTRLLKIDVRFARKTDDHVGRDRCLRKLLTNQSTAMTNRRPPSDAASSAARRPNRFAGKRVSEGRCDGDGRPSPAVVRVTSVASMLDSRTRNVPSSSIMRRSSEDNRFQSSFAQPRL